MSIFSCSACGGHSFKLSAGLKQAHCEDCKMYLGSWHALRTKIKKNIQSSQNIIAVEVDRGPAAMGFKVRVV
jgi:hypothetical protein